MLPFCSIVKAFKGDNNSVLSNNSTEHVFYYSAAILEQYIWTRNQVVIGLSYRPASLHRLAESIPWNRFLGSLKA